MKLIVIPVLLVFGTIYSQNIDLPVIDTISCTITVVLPFNPKENDDVTPIHASFVFETQDYSKSYNSSSLYELADGLIINNLENGRELYSENTKNLFASGFKVLDQVKKSGYRYNVLELTYKFKRAVISKKDLLTYISKKNDSILYNEVTKSGSKMNYYVIYIPL